MSEQDFDGHGVLVVGGTGGIGRATAVAFAAKGARVVVAGRNEAGGAETVAAIKAAGSEGRFVRTDVTRIDEVEGACAAVVGSFGRLDHAFNNAGWEGTMEKTADISPENWDRMISIKLNGVWAGMKFQLRQMLAQKSGTIVNMAGSWGLVGFPNYASYCAAAHGIMGLTRAASLEYAREGIRINAVCPGAVKAPLLDRMTGGDETAQDQFGQSTAMGRLCLPEEVADAVLWLSSAQSSYVNGHGLELNGGG
ncbi:MAG: SDR family oxidoreductase [Alphaproteobacteria bacterium]